MTRLVSRDAEVGVKASTSGNLSMSSFFKISYFCSKLKTCGNYFSAPPVPAAKLDAMISESMKDVDPNEDLSGDEDDPDLLVRDLYQSLAHYDESRDCIYVVKINYVKKLYKKTLYQRSKGNLRRKGQSGYTG